MQYNRVITLILNSKTTWNILRWKLSDSVCVSLMKPLVFNLRHFIRNSLSATFIYGFRIQLQMTEIIAIESVPFTHNRWFDLIWIVWIEWKWNCGSFESMRKIECTLACVCVCVWIGDLRYIFHLLVLFADALVTVTFIARVHHYVK